MLVLGDKEDRRNDCGDWRECTKDICVHSERVRMALLSLPPSRLVKLAAAVEGPI